VVRRLAPILAGVLLILAAGLLHGYWTLRWHSSPALSAAKDRLDSIPTDFGEWKAQPLQIPEDQLRQAGAIGWRLQSYSSPSSDVQTNTLLLAGRPGAMTIHRPEHCYPGAGYELKGRPVRYTVKDDAGEPLGDFWTARFVRETPTGPVSLRIFWSWNASGKWVAPDNPRWSLASEPYLYKLYVIREITQRVDKLDQEPSVAFLRELLPRLTPALTQ
jgi:hypothetical protein